MARDDYLIGLLLVYIFFIHGSSGDSERDSVFVIEGDSVTLHTGVNKNQQNIIKWYFNDTRIGEIRHLRKLCKDIQCKNGTERFRDKLKLDKQTGSLTITNITVSDSGDYYFVITSSNNFNEKTFSVTVHGVSDAERDAVKRKAVKKGESVTLNLGENKHPHDLMTCYFNSIIIGEINGDQSEICTDDQCKERFRDRLKLDHQTGSLTIMNTTTSDSGIYYLQINSSRFNIIRSFNVSVTAIETPILYQRSGHMIPAIPPLLALAAAVGVICHKYRSERIMLQRDDQIPWTSL